MAYIPEKLGSLPAELRSHSSDYFDFGKFKGSDVTVVGAGQSALETAAILHEEGATVRLLVRERAVVWNPTRSIARRSWYQRLRRPRTRFGDGLGHWVYDNAPGLFYHLPQHIRLEKVRRALGPAGARWLKDRIIGRVPILLGHNIIGAEVQSGRVLLSVSNQKQEARQLITDHVIAATAYKFNIQNLPFLSQSVKLRLRHEQQSPRLSSHFESSVPGLYFTGLGSANSFGSHVGRLAVHYPRRLGTSLTKSRPKEVRQ
jgi:hypothetical protein